jgi:hypothetical protein
MGMMNILYPDFMNVLPSWIDEESFAVDGWFHMVWWLQGNYLHLKGLPNARVPRDEFEDDITSEEKEEL